MWEAQSGGKPALSSCSGCSSYGAWTSASKACDLGIVLLASPAGSPVRPGGCAARIWGWSCSIRQPLRRGRVLAQPLRILSQPGVEGLPGRGTGRAPVSAGSAGDVARQAAPEDRVVDPVLRQQLAACLRSARGRRPRVEQAQLGAHARFQFAREDGLVRLQRGQRQFLVADQRQQRLAQAEQVPVGDVRLLVVGVAALFVAVVADVAGVEARRGTGTGRSRWSGRGCSCCRCSSRRGKSRPPAIARPCAAVRSLTCSSSAA